MSEAAEAAGRRRLSALVVARDEEGRIADCLQRLDFADEIVVLLDRSRDRTAEIARARGARVVEGEWELEADRRNAGIAACGGDWILEVDADEWATPALAAEIRADAAGGARRLLHRADGEPRGHPSGPLRLGRL